MWMTIGAAEFVMATGSAGSYRSFNTIELCEDARWAQAALFRWYLMDAVWTLFESFSEYVVGNGKCCIKTRPIPHMRTHYLVTDNKMVLKREAKWVVFSPAMVVWIGNRRRAVRLSCYSSYESPFVDAIHQTPSYSRIWLSAGQPIHDSIKHLPFPTRRTQWCTI